MTTATNRPPCDEASLTARLVLRSRESDDLPREERRALREHLAACGECRRRALSVDPTLLFAPLAGPSGGDTAGDDASGDGRRMAAEVRAVLEARRIDRRWKRPSRFLAAAALLVAGAGLAGLVALRPWGGGGTVLPNVATVAAAGSRAVPAASAPLVERMERPGVKVYQFAAEAPGQPAVVFVVDRNADL